MTQKATWEFPSCLLEIPQGPLVADVAASAWAWSCRDCPVLPTLLVKLGSYLLPQPNLKCSYVSVTRIMIRVAAHWHLLNCDLVAGPGNYTRPSLINLIPPYAKSISSHQHGPKTRPSGLGSLDIVSIAVTRRDGCCAAYQLFAELYDMFVCGFYDLHGKSAIISGSIVLERPLYDVHTSAKRREGANIPRFSFYTVD